MTLTFTNPWNYILSSPKSGMATPVLWGQSGVTFAPTPANTPDSNNQLIMIFTLEHNTLHPLCLLGRAQKVPPLWPLGTGVANRWPKWTLVGLCMFKYPHSVDVLGITGEGKVNTDVLPQWAHISVKNPMIKLCVPICFICFALLVVGTLDSAVLAPGRQSVPILNPFMCLKVELELIKLHSNMVSFLFS